LSFIEAMGNRDNVEKRMKAASDEIHTLQKKAFGKKFRSLPPRLKFYRVSGFLGFST
jgi:hypothetical protein